MEVVFQSQFSPSLERLLARHLKRWIVEVVAHYLIQGVAVVHPHREEEALQKKFGIQPDLFKDSFQLFRRLFSFHIGVCCSVYDC